MFRLLTVSLGLLLLGFGFHQRFIEAPMAEDPKATTLAQVQEIARTPGPHFVEFDARLARERKLYRTGVAAPAYASCPPDKAVGLTAESRAHTEQWVELLGCPVRVRGALSPDVVTVSQWKIDADADLHDPALLRSRWILAPVTETNARLWVLSKKFAHHPTANDGKGTRLRTDIEFGPFRGRQTPSSEEWDWMAKDVLTGRLTLFEELHRNHVQLDAVMLEGVLMATEGVRRNQNLAERSGANDFVVIGDAGLELHTLPAPDRPRVLVPVEDSGDTLFVALNWNQPAPEDGRISGLVEPFESPTAAELAEALDVTPSGLVRLGSPEEHNARRASNAYFTMVAGGVVLGFGLLLVYLDRALSGASRRRRR